MTSPSPTPGAGGPSPGWTPPRASGPRSRRRPALVALGVALAAVGALVAVYLVNAAGHRSAVLVLARNVPLGAVVQRADLATAQVSVDPEVATVPASEVDGIVGKVAVGALAAGSLMSPAQVADAGPVTAGRMLVPLSLPHARVPASGLVAGDRLLVVDSPAQDADPPTAPPSSIPALVVRVGAADLNGVTTVDVTVATGDGPALAARAATGRIAIVVQPKAS